MSEFEKLLGLDVEALKRSSALLRKQSGFGCDECDYKGYYTKHNGLTYMCSCVKENFLKELFVKASVPKKYLGKQISDWNTRTDDNGNDLGILQSISENVYRLMQSYEKHLANICYGSPPKILHSINVRTNLHSICFYGASGSGKTFIASVLVQSAIRKSLTAKYYDWTDIVQLLTDFDKKKEIDELVEELKNIDFACIDGIENFNISNPYLTLQLDRISKARLNSGKPYMLFGNGEIERISNGSGWQSLISNCLSIRLPHAIKKS